MNASTALAATRFFTEALENVTVWDADDWKRLHGPVDDLDFVVTAPENTPVNHAAALLVAKSLDRTRDGVQDCSNVASVLVFVTHS